MYRLWLMRLFTNKYLYWLCIRFECFFFLPFLFSIRYNVVMYVWSDAFYWRKIQFEAKWKENKMLSAALEQEHAELIDTMIIWRWKHTPIKSNAKIKENNTNRQKWWNNNNNCIGGRKISDVFSLISVFFFFQATNRETNLSIISFRWFVTWFIYY